MALNLMKGSLCAETEIIIIDKTWMNFNYRQNANVEFVYCFGKLPVIVLIKVWQGLTYIYNIMSFNIAFCTFNLLELSTQSWPCDRNRFKVNAIAYWFQNRYMVGDFKSKSLCACLPNAGHGNCLSRRHCLSRRCELSHGAYD